MRTSTAILWIALAVSVAASSAVSCGDPVHEAEVKALGPEAMGVQRGPNHRPGQPCLTCHGGLGPGSPTFVTAGTVYLEPYALGAITYKPLVYGTVHLVDAHGLGYDAITNTVGNFYVTGDQWNPAFPLGAESADAGLPDGGCIPVGSDASASAGEIFVSPPPDGGACKATPAPMMTAIERGGVYASCAYCHFDPPGPTSPGHVYQDQGDDEAPP